MAILLRLHEEDRAKYPGGDEGGWVRFDPLDLDDLSLKTLNEYEAAMNCSIEFLLRVDQPAQTVRWTAARVWLARKMAGITTPDLPDFDIKVRKVEIKDEPKLKRTTKAKAGDADPPSSSPSSEAEASETVSE